MSEVKFLARFPKIKEIPGIHLTDEEREERRINEIIGKDMVEDNAQEFEVRFEYAKVVFDLTEVKLYYEYDKRHTFIGLYDGDSFVIKTKFNIFRLIKEQMTGKMVRDAEDFRFEEKLAKAAVDVKAILSSMPGITVENGITSQGNITDTTTERKLPFKGDTDYGNINPYNPEDDSDGA